mmetsp:Transcript_20197/g.52102  ORF Transcript_20197/g.52102 Transcript_20197/m.52102 type:complete len:225 (-) Transcript_20197:962-1636(-)
MTLIVATSAPTYAHRFARKYGRACSRCFMSKRSMSATKMPGITMSPRPSRENSTFSACRSLGKSSLIGASIPLATVTITSVPNTQKMSYRKSAHSSSAPIWKEPSESISMAHSEKEAASTFASTQRLVSAYASETPTPSASRGTSSALNSIFSASACLSQNCQRSRHTCVLRACTAGSACSGVRTAWCTAPAPSPKKYTARSMLRYSFLTNLTTTYSPTSTAEP